MAIQLLMQITENRNAFLQSSARKVYRLALTEHALRGAMSKVYGRARLAVAVIVVAVTMALPGSSHTFAQNLLPDSAAAETDSTPAGKESAGTARRLTAPPNANEHVVFVNKDGEVVRLLAGGQIADYLEWRKQLLQDTGDDRPGYYVAAITLAGKVSDDRAVATLDASIEVFVREGGDRVEVPLRLNEATLLKHGHNAPVPIEFLPRERSTGMKCRITGPGQHRIDLRLSVPIRKSGNSYRLQLSLPGTAQSSLRLSVPGEVIAVRPGELADIEVQSLSESHSELIVHGLGAALDLPWQVVNAQQEVVKTELQVESLMAADAGVDGLAVEAVQTITATRGSFDTVSVTVPQGFEALSVSSSTHESMQYSDLQNDPIVISLRESTAGPIRLKWLLSAKANANRFSISGFNVQNSARQETLFGVSVAEGFRLIQPALRPQQVTQIPTSLFRKRVETQFDPQVEFQQAYRLHGRNSRVQFQLDRVEASYRVSPNYELLFRETTADLTARFEIIVYRGSLDHVRLRWPGLKLQEWSQIEVVEPAERVHIAGITPSGSEASENSVAKSGTPAIPDEIDLRFVEALNRTHGAVTVEIRARRPVQIGEEAFPISVPTVESDSVPVSRVTLRNASNVESTLTASGQTDVRLITDGTSGASARAARGPLNLVPRTLESTSGNLEFRATVTTHPQEVTSSSQAVLAFSEDRIDVEQRLHYSVTYEELDRLRILVPGSVRPDEFRLVSNNEESAEPLTAEVGGLEIDGVRQIRVNLPEPRLGQFDILCRYSVPVDSAFVNSGMAEADVPLLQPSETKGEATRVEIRAPGNVGVQLVGPQWTQEMTLNNAPSWIATGTIRNVSLTLEAAPERARQNFVVRRSALRTRFQDGAATRTHGVYLIDGDISFLTVMLPAGADQFSLNVWWDGERLGSDRLVMPFSNNVSTGAANGRTPANGTGSVNGTETAVEGESEVRILVDGLPGRDQHTLSLAFDAAQGEGFGGINELHMNAPRFASDVWLADTLWEVVLPIDQHLLVYPKNYTPGFSWQRSGIAWGRQPVDADLSLSNWLLADVDPASRPLLESELEGLKLDLLESVPYGNSYLFSAFGHQHEVSLQTMSQPAIILAGAGLTLAIGLLLLRIPTTRHVLTILVAGFGLSVAGLWHLEAVQLLLQPAVFGLMLAVIASVIEARVKRRQRASLVTFSSPSDFLAPGSSREEIIHGEPSELSERQA